MLRSTAFNVTMFGSGLVLSLWAMLTTPARPEGILRVARLWARLCLWALRRLCRIDIAAANLNYLPARGGAIIAAQHQSALDILIWTALLPAPSFVFKTELKRLPLFGALLEPAGMIPVDREGGAVALMDMVARVRDAVAAGRQVVVFPEGTRVAFGRSGTIRPGIVALVRAIEAPVFPATTDSGRHWGRKAYQKTPGTVSVALHPALAERGKAGILATLAAIFAP